MFFSAGRHRFLAVAALLVTAFEPGCRRAQPGGVTRVAVLPVENLTGDASLDWLSSAAPAVITTQLSPAQEVRAVAAGAIRDAYAARAGQVLHASLTTAGGGLRLSCVLEDLGRRRTIRVFTAAIPDRAGLFDLLGQVSRAMSASTRPYPTSSLEALRRLAQAEDATAADPDFGPGYIARARWLAARGEPPEALKTLRAAQARGDRIAPIERAEIAALAAALAGDREARVRALTDLAALTPADVQPPRALGQLEFAAWRLEPAVNWFRRALAIEPDSVDSWNLLAYAEAQRGEFGAALQSVSEYARLAGDDPNAQDSVGDIHFMAGDFAAAERSYLAASSMNASWQGGDPLRKAAYARVMTGDVGGADGLFARYLELRQGLKDPRIEYRRAQWEFLTGRRRQALKRMEAFGAAGPGEAAAQLAVWKRQLGGASPEQLPPAFALLLDGHFREASEALKEMIRKTPPSAAGELRTLAAWALIESGQLEAARDFAFPWPPPEPQGEPVFASLAMPRMLQVRSRLTTGAESTRLAAVYEKLKGDLPDAR